MQWYKVQGSVYPILEDTTSSKVYNYVRKNVEEKRIITEYGTTTVYEYDEMKVKKSDWGTFLMIAGNTEDISDNSEGLFDVAELAGENSEGIYDLADLVADLEERVAALEGKEG